MAWTYGKLRRRNDLLCADSMLFDDFIVMNRQQMPKWSSAMCDVQLDMRVVPCYHYNTQFFGQLNPAKASSNARTGPEVYTPNLLLGWTSLFKL